MKGFKEQYGTWALITGASSGIGAEFAQQLGAHGLNLVLVARRLKRLQQLATQIAEQHQVEVRPVECDLSKVDFMDRLKPHLTGLDIGLLINNAGFANTGAVVDNDLERELELLAVNCRAYLILAHEIGNRLKTRGRGGIIFVSSSMAFTPAAQWGHYCASKAYELALGEAMHDEMRDQGVDVLVVCPGPTRTEFYQVSRQDLAKTPQNTRFLIIEPDQVVTTALDSLGKIRNVVPGWGMRLILRLVQFLPREIAAKNPAAFVAATRLD